MTELVSLLDDEDDAGVMVSIDDVLWWTLGAINLAVSFLLFDTINHDSFVT